MPKSLPFISATENETVVTRLQILNATELVAVEQAQARFLPSGREGDLAAFRRAGAVLHQLDLRQEVHFLQAIRWNRDGPVSSEIVDSHREWTRLRGFDKQRRYAVRRRIQERRRRCDYRHVYAGFGRGVGVGEDARDRIVRDLRGDPQAPGRRGDRRLHQSLAFAIREPGTFAACSRHE
jgi:hypothetical protein